MGGNVFEAAFVVKLFHARLNRSNVAQYTVVGDMRNDFFESRNRGFESNCVNNHFWTECIYFLKPCETLRVVHETQTLWIGIENSRFVIKTQEVDKE